MPILTLKAGGYGGQSAPNAPVLADVVQPTPALGLFATPGNGTLTWAWDQAADVSTGLATATGVTGYPLVLGGVTTVVTAPSSNILPVPTLTQIGTSGASASQSGTSWTITGAGNGLDGTSDQINFVGWQISGDFKVQCRVASFTGAGYEYAYAGVTVRESLSAGSKHLSMYQWLSAGNKGVQAKHRLTTSAGSTSFGSANGDGSPRFVQIERTGTQVTYRYSTDGGAWSTLAQETVSFTDSVYVGGFESDLGGSPVSLVAVLEDLCYVPSARVSYVQTTGSTTLGSVAARDANALESAYSPPKSYIPGTAPPVGNAMKRRGGTYMWSSLQSYRPITDPVIYQHHIDKINVYGANPNIAGIQLLVDWSGLEGDVQGNFTSAARAGHMSVYAAVKGILDRLQFYGKTLMLGLTPLHFGNYSPSYKNYQFPAYLFNSAGSGTTYDFYGTPRQEDGFGSNGAFGLTPLVGPVDLPGGGTGIGFRGITARIWQDATANALNNVTNWLGATFDSHPAFEMITFGETSLNVLPGYNSAGYSNDELRRQSYRFYTAARAAFPTSQVRCSANDFGDDNPHMLQLLAFCQANAIIPGGPSVRRDDYTQADRVYVGMDDYGNISYTDYRPTMPWCAEVQDPEMAIWTASQLRSAANDGYTTTRQRKRAPGDPPYTQNGGYFNALSTKSSYFIWPDQDYPAACQWTRDILPLINSTSGQTYWGAKSNIPTYPLFYKNGINTAAP